MSPSHCGAVFEFHLNCFRMHLLLLLAAMIVARSQCAQWVTQQRGHNDNTLMEGVDKELKSAAEQVSI